jgi:hypothetical protein
VPQSVVDPDDPQAIVEHLYRVQRVVDGRLEFGSPQDPRDPAGTALATGTAHNGTILNILGSWVELDVTSQDAPVACVHNLDVPVTSVSGVNQPNVRWLVFGWQHNGAGAAPGSTMSCNYEPTDAASITSNSFPLRFYAAGRTIGADPNDLRVTLFFVPAVR